jgi:hypothetical protein
MYQSLLEFEQLFPTYTDFTISNTNINFILIVVFLFSLMFYTLLSYCIYKLYDKQQKYFDENSEEHLLNEMKNLLDKLNDKNQNFEKSCLELNFLANQFRIMGYQKLLEKD